MPRAGFYAVESGRISFRRDGFWYSDDERIENPRIGLLFSRSLHRDPAGRYYLQVGDERAAVEIQDTPYIVIAVDRISEDGFSIALNDGTSEALDCRSLETGCDNVLYCTVKDGQFKARFLRAAYYHLAPFFCVGAGGEFFLNAGGRHFPIRGCGDKNLPT